MKALIVGGVGMVGQAVARSLLNQEVVKKITLGDIVTDESRLHEKLRTSDKVSLIRIDVNDHEALVQAMKDIDVVVNCAGPFYRTGPAVAKAAIEAKVNYVDICDDYEVINFLFTPELDEAAKKAGVTILTGMGSDPGTNNLIAKYFANKLDRVDEIALYWVIGLADLGERATWGAAWDHSLYMNLGNVPQYLDGKIEYVPAGSGDEMVEFPEPLGTCRLRYVGHPQPLTIPRYIKGVRTVTIKGGFLPAWVDELIKEQKEQGFLSLEPVEVKGVKVVPYDLTRVLWRKIPENRDRGPVASGLKVVVKGEREGKRVTYSCEMVGRTAPGTGIPASIGALMLYSGEVKVKGVVPPEGCIDAEKFVEAFLKRGAKIHLTETITSLMGS